MSILDAEPSHLTTLGLSKASKWYTTTFNAAKLYYNYLLDFFGTFRVFVLKQVTVYFIHAITRFLFLMDIFGHCIYNPDSKPLSEPCYHWRFLYWFHTPKLLIGHNNCNNPLSSRYRKCCLGEFYFRSRNSLLCSWIVNFLLFPYAFSPFIFKSVCKLSVRLSRAHKLCSIIFHI